MRALWKKFWLRGLHFHDRRLSIEALYTLKDPWNLDTPAERHRFVETNRILRRAFGTVDRVLEIGSGEGLQSRFLLQMCRDLHGIDLSRTAVERARGRVPATFSHGDVRSALPVLDSQPPFDLVTAFEMLYYVKYPSSFVARMCSLGRACAVSYHEPQRAALDPVFADVPVEGRAEIVYGAISWSLLWWRNPQGTGETHTAH